ncbi:ADP-ribosyltransferase domain-containing protein [Aquabacter sp. P-9]|uniref:ADP-ribosyltransferase domain-containing protein n=1 Tax=Aquabacter sediminis TaxID=3029197 RepID=UPI00237D55A4|nr:ADP-ribosyltransferase domain-containing protein [Aquabacter sp. P-9]MDE1570390.1 ADP-ribosyltransferase domain-containing protein [Aquabacter sp. P-9]
MDHLFVGLVDDLSAAKQRCGFDRPSDPYGLTPYERLAVWVWSVSAYPVGEMNARLRKGVPITEAERGFCRLLTDALEKIPPIQQRVYRGVRDDGGLGPVPERFAQGTVHRLESFTSTSLDIQAAYAGNVLMLMSSLTGRPIMMYSDDPLEQKVLFLPGTPFVSDGGWVGEKGYVILLREVL